MPPVSELLGRLVAINSIPDLVPGSPGEGAGAHAVEEWVDLVHPHLPRDRPRVLRLNPWRNHEFKNLP